MAKTKTPFEQIKQEIRKLKHRKALLIKELKEINKLEKELILMVASPELYNKLKGENDG